MRSLKIHLAAALACMAAFGVPQAAENGIQHWDVGRGSIVDALLENGGRASVTFVSGISGRGTAANFDFGCIEIVTAAGSDRGCGSAPMGGAVDETLNSGTLRFTVPSAVYDGGTLTVNITLAAYGSYSVDQPLAVDPGSPVTIDAAARVVRLAVPAGGATSSTVGGGLLQSNGDGMLFQGSSVSLTVES